MVYEPRESLAFNLLSLDGAIDSRILIIDV
jgi:hypothetical protein